MKSNKISFPKCYLTNNLENTQKCQIPPGGTALPFEALLVTL